MKKLTIFIVIVSIILLIAFISKPSDPECRQVATDHKMQSYDALLFEGLARKIVTKNISIKDRIIYKEINFSYDGSTFNIGWAAFGQVFMN